MPGRTDVADLIRTEMVSAGVLSLINGGAPGVVLEVGRVEDEQLRRMVERGRERAIGPDLPRIRKVPPGAQPEGGHKPTRNQQALRPGQQTGIQSSGPAHGGGVSFLAPRSG